MSALPCQVTTQWPRKIARRSGKFDGLAPYPACRPFTIARISVWPARSVCGKPFASNCDELQYGSVWKFWSTQEPLVIAFAKYGRSQ